jgi:two-component system, cell cycle sensor histidine kinase and response regulator CckA
MLSSIVRRILVADDTPLLLDVVKRTLVRAGYTVTAAKDGREALEQFESDPAAYDALVLDIEMPRLDGISAWSRMDELRPGIPVLFWSGEIARYEPQLPQRPNVAYAQKPVSLPDLVQKLQGAIFGSAGL